MHKQYYIEQKKVEKLISRRNQKADFYNGIYDRYEYPVLTREFAPVHWRYDLNEETNPYFMERLGINAVMNSGAIELDGKYYLSKLYDQTFTTVFRKASSHVGKAEKENTKE